MVLVQEMLQMTRRKFILCKASMAVKNSSSYENRKKTCRALHGVKTQDTLSARQVLPTIGFWRRALSLLGSTISSFGGVLDHLLLLEAIFATSRSILALL